MLSHQVDPVTLGLLANLPAWRQRAIERIELSNALWSKREREIHVKSLDATTGQIQELQGFLDVQPEEDLATIILPITELSYVPLLDLHITVAGEPVYRVPLDEGARIQAYHIQRLASNVKESLSPKIRRKVRKKLDVDEELLDLLTSIFYFPTLQYETLWKEYRQLTWHPNSWLHWNNPTKVYLETIFGDLHEKKRLFELASGIRKYTAEYSMPDPFNAAQNPLIALPRLKEEFNDLSEIDCIRRLEKLSQLLSCAVEQQDGPARRACESLLSTYTAYGYRWMAFAKCSVPVSRPFIITVTERRSVYFGSRWSSRYKNGPVVPVTKHLSSTVWKQISFHDAETNHVSIRLSDTAVRLRGKCEPLDETGNRVKTNADIESQTFELYLRHDSSEGRPERMWIKSHLRLNRLVSLFFCLAMTVTAIATGLLIWRGLFETKGASDTRGLTAKDMSVILLPAAFVASLLLVKESSTLSVRLRRLKQGFVTIELFALLLVAFGLYLFHEVLATP
ncbi:hypothetical protein ACFY3O_32845 [Streptomyces sp. NPDC001046]|uniref:hypothetical protein n=1 Tax=Streptomyces sp. NPDC001046 TaxID=3364543 RepID=UPI0036D0609B